MFLAASINLAMFVFDHVCSRVSLITLKALFQA